jgi:hypothetical protein
LDAGAGAVRFDWMRGGAAGHDDHDYNDDHPRSDDGIADGRGGNARGRCPAGAADGSDRSAK